MTGTVRKWPLNLPVVAVLLFLYAPIAILVVFAFNDSAISYSGADSRYGGSTSWPRKGSS